MVEIANIVGSGSLGVELDVERLGADLDVPYSEYDPDNYHGLYVRLEEDGPLITIYRSGKYIISGCSTFERLRKANRNFIGELCDLEILESDFKNRFEVQNVVCTANLDRNIDLSTLAISLGLEVVEYEPEQFPGLVYRPPDFPAVLLVFANGKVVITGASDTSTAEEAFSSLETHLTND